MIYFLLLYVERYFLMVYFVCFEQHMT